MMRKSRAFPWPKEQLLEWHSQGKTPYEMAQLLSVESWQQSLWIPAFDKPYTPSPPAVRLALLRLGCQLHKGRRFGAESRKWRGGKKIGKGGYMLILKKDHPHANSQGYVPEHRLVAEQILGRYLDPRETVHHIDDNPLNNAPENLEVFANNGDHVTATIDREARAAAARKGWSHAREKYREAHRLTAAKRSRDSQGHFLPDPPQEPDARPRRQTPIRLKEQPEVNQPS